MIYLGKNADAGIYDIQVRNADYPSGDSKLLIQKGSVKISVPYADAADFLAALAKVALSNN
jgi:hypothetical protein